MSELPQQVTIQQYLADGTTTVYAYNFQILVAGPMNNDIIVYVQPPGSPAIPSAQVQPLNVAYTVQGVGNLLGGTITFQSGYIPVASSIITIARNMAVSSDTEFNQVQNFNGQNLDNAIARITLIQQQLSSFQFLRAIGYAINSYIPAGNTDQVLPLLANNQIWQKINGAIQAVTLEENPDVSTLRSNLLSEIMGSDGTSIIGYYDAVNNVPQLLSTFLNDLPTYINNVVHPSTTFQSGMIIDFGGSVAPTGWLIANGIAVSRTTYSSLFAAITFIQAGQLTSGFDTVSGLTDTSQMYVGMQITGTGIQSGTIISGIVDANNITISPNATTTAIENITFYPWGAGDESTTFDLPGLNGSTTIGFGGASTATIGNVTGQQGGETDHTLTTAEVPNLTVIVSGSLSPTSTVSGAVGKIALGSGTTSTPFPFSATGGTTNGGGGSHNNMQPSTVLMKIIKI